MLKDALSAVIAVIQNVDNFRRIKMVTVYVEVCREGIELPKYANIGDSGMDVRAAEDVTIYPQDTAIIPTGLKMAIPEGYEVQVRARSGISYRTPLRISNGIGTIDSSFKDEIGVIITNTSCGFNNINEYYLNEQENREGIYHIKKGDRIAQLVMSRVPKMMLVKIDDVSKIGVNRHGGIGSTGIA
jgi:dUTP pyrophosphatase